MIAMLRTIPFYLESWVEDPFVSKLTNEQLGAYWKLLVYQAVHDGLPDEDAKVLLGQDYERLWAVLGSKFPVKNGVRKNLRMDQAVQFAKDSYRRRELNKKTGFELTEDQIQNLFRSFPKRPNPKEGQTKARELLPSIVKNFETFDMLMKAVQNYCAYTKKNSKDKTREDAAKYVKKIDKWLAEWQDWIPVEEAEGEAVVKEEAVPVFGSLDEELRWRRSKGMLSKYPVGARFPWEPRYGAPDYELAAIKRTWTDDKKRVEAGLGI